MLLLFVGADVNDTFSHVRLEPPYEKFLANSPLLMEAAGAKVIKTKTGDIVLLSVAATPLKDGSARDRLRAMKVCRAKAFAHIVGETEGVQVAYSETLNEKTVVTIENGQEKAESVSDLLSVTMATIHGLARGMTVAGTWRSKDGELYYMALGRILTADELGSK